MSTYTGKWRVFRWNSITGRGSFDERMSSSDSYSVGSTHYHTVPVVLCPWNDEPGDKQPNVRRTEINLYPDNPKR